MDKIIIICRNIGWSLLQSDGTALNMERLASLSVEVTKGRSIAIVVLSSSSCVRGCRRTDSFKLLEGKREGR